jgi:RHS repeat-associated protein
VVALINTNGSVGRRFDYDAYGHSITLEADYSPGAYEYDFEYRYAGYRWDYETHLLQVRNRWYHPRLGRWVSRDPIAYNGGMNLYAYVGGNPIKDVDPYGERKWKAEDVDDCKTTILAGHTTWVRNTISSWRKLYTKEDKAKSKCGVRVHPIACKSENISEISDVIPPGTELSGAPLSKKGLKFEDAGKVLLEVVNRAKEEAKEYACSVCCCKTVQIHIACQPQFAYVLQQYPNIPQDVRELCGNTKAKREHNNPEAEGPWFENKIEVTCPKCE